MSGYVPPDHVWSRNLRKLQALVVLGGGPLGRTAHTGRWEFPPLQGSRAETLGATGLQTGSVCGSVGMW